MTAFLIVLGLVVLAGVAASVRALRRDRPVAAPPRSHRAWHAGPLPSSPYAVCARR